MHHLFLVFALAAAPPELKDKTAAQVFAEVLPELDAVDVNKRQKAQQRWESLCLQAGAKGNEALRADLCKRMAEQLEAKASATTRVFLLQQLQFLGRDECLAAVIAALADADERVHDAAVRCLASNPTPAATAPLLERLPAAKGKRRVGLVNALGYRGDAAAVTALAQELTGAEPAAAARALGKIGTPEAAKALDAARTKVQGPARHWVADAYLLCADRRLKEGKEDQAAAIYETLLNAKDVPRAIHLAAWRGSIASAGPAAGAMILVVLAGNDAGAVGVALESVQTVSPKALTELAAGLNNLPAPRQVQLLVALAARGDRAAEPAALGALKSTDEKVRQAAVQALGKLGDAATVPTLVDLTLNQPALAAAARESLMTITGPGVDERIIAALRAQNEPARRVTLIGVLEGRRTAAAVPVLLDEARGADANVRASALAALRSLAEPRDVPALLELLHKAPKGREHDEAERTLLAVCGRIPDPEAQAAPIFAVLDVSADSNAWVELLPLLGKLGGNRVLRDARAAAASNDPKTHAAGVQALCNWPDPAASEDLLKLAQGADPKQREQALRSLIRVNSLTTTLPGDKANPGRLAMLKQAMDLATRDDERGQVLDGVAKIKEPASLRFALPYLNDPKLAQRACRTVVELAHSKTLREPHKAEFERALDRVLAICRDQGLIERAKKYKAGE